MKRTLTALALTGAAVLAGTSPALASTAAPAGEVSHGSYTSDRYNCHWQYNYWQHHWYVQCEPRWHQGDGDHDRDDRGGHHRNWR
jgi:hypothetical protein